MKLDLKERRLHKDDLPEQHFTDLRHFLLKKHRQEAVAAKMARGRGGMRGGSKGGYNDDLQANSRLGDREIEIGSELGSPNSKKRSTPMGAHVGGQPV